MVGVPFIVIFHAAVPGSLHVDAAFARLTRDAEASGACNALARPRRRA
jgi:hypothetical protein